MSKKSFIAIICLIVFVLFAVSSFASMAHIMVEHNGVTSLSHCEQCSLFAVIKNCVEIATGAVLAAVLFALVCKKMHLFTIKSSFLCTTLIGKNIQFNI